MSSRSSAWRSPRRLLPLALLVLVLPALVAVIATTRSNEASAHGNAVYPMTRNYSCWKRWATNGASFQDPTMAQKDPMCWQAWQADPNAMWNWNGLLRDGLGQQFEQKIPNGTLCSGGGSANSGGRYSALDKPGPWQATDIPRNFNMLIADQAHHGGWYRVYVTKDGYDPLTQPLGWGDLQQLTQTQNYAPGAGDPNGPEGSVGVSFPVAIPQAVSGRRIVFTIWQAAHSDQSYFWCSDVNVGGSSGGGPVVTTPTSAPATTTTTWSYPTTTTPGSPTTTVPGGPDPTTPTPGNGACAATFEVVGVPWPGGYQGKVTISAPGAVNGWQVSGQVAGNIKQVWSATAATGSSTLSATNVAWNGKLPAGGSTSFGFLSDGVPAPTTLSCSAS
jgi:predicted carbohydrate-binding protein with CBM5 and CBM33 domain